MCLTLLGLQSRFGDNLGQATWKLSGVSPKRDCGSKIMQVVRVPTRQNELLLRGTTVNRTYDGHKNLYVSNFYSQYLVLFTMAPRNK